MVRLETLKENKKRLIYTVNPVYDEDTVKNAENSENVFVYDKVEHYEDSKKNKNEDEKEKLIFDYVTKDAFAKLENPIVVGSIKLDEQSKSKKVDVAIIETEESTFTFELEKTEDEQKINDKIIEYMEENKLSEISSIENILLEKEDSSDEEEVDKIENKDHYLILGYVEVADNTFIVILKKAAIIPWLWIVCPIILLLLILLCLFTANKKDVQVTPDNPSLEIADGTDWDGNMPQNGENSQADTGSIEIPGYANLFISTSEPDVQLINPSSNDVYFVYTIKNGDEVLEETKAIEPGKALNVPLGTMLGVGEHQVSFEISCFDVETQAPCNGAVQSVKITVR